MPGVLPIRASSVASAARARSRGPWSFPKIPIDKPAEGWAPSGLSVHPIDEVPRDGRSDAGYRSERPDPGRPIEYAHTNSDVPPITKNAACATRPGRPLLGFSCPPLQPCPPCQRRANERRRSARSAGVVRYFPRTPPEKSYSSRIPWSSGIFFIRPPLPPDSQPALISRILSSRSVWTTTSSLAWKDCPSRMNRSTCPERSGSAIVSEGINRRRSQPRRMRRHACAVLGGLLRVPLGVHPSIHRCQDRQGGQGGRSD